MLPALDRYWSITKAISYLHQRTPNRVAFMIVMVWILSALISIPPLMGWKEEQNLGSVDLLSHFMKVKCDSWT